MSSAAGILARFLKIFFHLIYHPLAFTYDWVAKAVSLGQWISWVYTVLPFVRGNTILELGFGTGHLQSALAQRGYHSYGVDKSRQMLDITRRRLSTHRLPIRLARSTAEQLPFAGRTFTAVVATFPTEFIFSPHTLSELRRVLKPEGVLIILLGTWITGSSPLERSIAFLYQITGQAPSPSYYSSPILQALMHAGFIPKFYWIDQPGARLLLMEALVK